MALADHVHVARRFQRAIRIDTDLTSPSALEGFICPRSSADVLGDHGPPRCGDGSRRIHVDGTVRQRQVESGGGVERPVERERRAEALRGVDPWRRYGDGRLGRLAAPYQGLAYSARGGSA